MRLLLSKHADTESKDGGDQSVLSWAAKNGHEDVIKLLLTHDANPNSVDSTGMSPLLWALHRGDGAIVALFSNKKFSHCPPHMHKKPRRHRRRRFSSCKIPVTPGEAHKAYE